MQNLFHHLRQASPDDTVSLAKGLIAQMEKDGVKPDSFTFSSAISVSGAAGDWKEAINLINTMMKESPKDPYRTGQGKAINVQSTVL